HRLPSKENAAQGNAARFHPRYCDRMAMLRLRLAGLLFAAVCGCGRDLSPVHSFESLRAEPPGKPSSNYLCLGFGLHTRRFEFFIDNKLILAGSTSSEVDRHANLLCAVPAKELVGLPEHFTVRVTIDGQPSFEGAFDRSKGRYLAVAYDRFKNAAAV